MSRKLSFFLSHIAIALITICLTYIQNLLQPVRISLKLTTDRLISVQAYLSLSDIYKKLNKGLSDIYKKHNKGLSDMTINLNSGCLTSLWNLSKPVWYHCKTYFRQSNISIRFTSACLIPQQNSTSLSDISISFTKSVWYLNKIY